MALGLLGPEARVILFDPRVSFIFAFTVVAKVELSRNCKENVAAMVDIYSRGGAGPRTRLPSQGCLVPPLIAATPALTAR